MTIEQVQTLIVGGGQAGLAMSHMLESAWLLTSCARTGADRRTLADGTLGRLAVPVSELVGPATGFSLSAR